MYEVGCFKSVFNVFNLAVSWLYLLKQVFAEEIGK